ncbi:hypothetical protein MKW94_024950 [Papaver nudicaule]|uniref:Uncharacterized protein n=1 Tax=Papaver nudicaule TaxID=74823 RepID=A0AA41SGD6_PAPNU|nr:hypothetical protein [Papaver nudicaule]
MVLLPQRQRVMGFHEFTDGKPHRPVTRGFCKQQLQANKVSKPVQNKVAKRRRREKVIEISPHTEEEVVNKGYPGRKALTTYLTAHSKFACGSACKTNKDNIDGGDADNQLAAVEYVEELYRHYKLAESSSLIYDYMDSQHQINEKCRMVLVDWLIESHGKLYLTPETLYLTIQIVDRYLSAQIVHKEDLQLLGITSMLIAGKYEEERSWAPKNSILSKLEWTLSIPTPYVFLVRFVKAAKVDKMMENMVYFLAELGLMQYAVIMFSPSMLATSAVYAARCILSRTPLWDETLKLHTGFRESQIKECAKQLVSFHCGVAQPNFQTPDRNPTVASLLDCIQKCKLQAVYRKYSSPELSAVALLPPAKSLLA